MPLCLTFKFVHLVSKNFDVLSYVISKLCILTFELGVKLSSIQFKSYIFLELTQSMLISALILMNRYNLLAKSLQTVGEQFIRVSQYVFVGFDLLFSFLADCSVH